MIYEFWRAGGKSAGQWGLKAILFIKNISFLVITQEVLLRYELNFTENYLD